MYESPLWQSLKTTKGIPWEHPRYIGEFVDRELEHAQIPHLVTKFDPNPHEVMVRKHTARLPRGPAGSVLLAYDLCILYKVLHDKNIRELATKNKSDLELVIQGALKQDKLRERVTIFSPLPFQVLSAEPNVNYDTSHSSLLPYNPSEMVLRTLHDLRAFFDILL